MAVWMSLMIGQPLAILMYYHDYYIINYGMTGTAEANATQFCVSASAKSLWLPVLTGQASAKLSSAPAEVWTLNGKARKLLNKNSCDELKEEQWKWKLQAKKAHKRSESHEQKFHYVVVCSFEDREAIITVRWSMCAQTASVPTCWECWQYRVEVDRLEAVIAADFRIPCANRFVWAKHHTSCELVCEKSDLKRRIKVSISFQYELLV